LKIAAGGYSRDQVLEAARVAQKHSKLIAFWVEFSTPKPVKLQGTNANTP